MTKPIMQLKNIRKSFDGQEVLHDVSLDVNEGEVTVILGPSGSGKSTLLRCMNGLEDIDSGEIIFKGQTVDQTEKTWEGLRQEIGMVFQSYDLFPNKNVLDNCTLAPVKVKGEDRAEVETRARHYLERVGLKGYEDRMPSQLSGGQKQRVAIVRCLCMEPKLILLDEITASLDLETVNEVLLVILELAKENRTMVIVTHEMSFARRVSDQVVFLENGEILEITPTEEFFEHPRTDRAQSFLDNLDFDAYAKEEAEHLS